MTVEFKDIKEKALDECKNLRYNKDCPITFMKGEQIDLCSKLRLFCEDVLDIAVEKLSQEKSDD